MWPSGTTQVDTTMQGGSFVATNDHAQDHRQLGSVVNSIPTVFGTTPGTNLLTNIKNASDQIVGMNTGGTLSQTFSKGTANNMTLGTPSLTGGTINNPTIGTPNIQNGTIGTTSIVGGTATGITIGSTSILQPLNSAFWVTAGTQALAALSTVQIAWGSSNYDLLNEIGTTNSFIAKQAGLYQFNVILQMTGGGNFGQIVQIRLNGTAQQGFVANPSVTYTTFWQGSVMAGGTVDVANVNTGGTAGTIIIANLPASFYGKRVF